MWVEVTVTLEFLNVLCLTGRRKVKRSSEVFFSGDRPTVRREKKVVLLVLLTFAGFVPFLAVVGTKSPKVVLRPTYTEGDVTAVMPVLTSAQIVRGL